MMKLLPGLLAMLYVPALLAGSATGRVAGIYLSNTSPAVLFDMTAAIEGTPRCNESRRFAIDTSKFGGSTSYQALLEAKRENYLIAVEGLNTCVADWKSEDVKTIHLK